MLSLALRAVIYLLAFSGHVLAANLTSLVNLFIGTGSSGNAFPGAAIPHAMVKVRRSN